MTTVRDFAHSLLVNRVVGRFAKQAVHIDLGGIEKGDTVNVWGPRMRLQGTGVVQRVDEDTALVKMEGGGSLHIRFEDLSVLQKKQQPMDLRLLLSSSALHFLKDLIAMGNERANFGVWPQQVKPAKELEEHGMITLKPTYRHDKPYTGELTKKGWDQRGAIAKGL
jgi:hypothetical protein